MDKISFSKAVKEAPQGPLRWRQHATRYGINRTRNRANYQATMSNVHPVVRPGHVAFHVGLIRRCPSQCPADVRRVQIEVGKADIGDLVNSRTKLRNLMKSGDETCLDINALSPRRQQSCPRLRGILEYFALSAWTW